MTKALYTDATCSAASSMSTDKLHERVCAPFTLSCSPNRAFDAGLRPGPFPDRAASLLPGLLAATRTGLTPAGDDELQSGHHRWTITS